MFKESLRFTVLAIAILVTLASPAQDLPTFSEMTEAHNRRVESFESLIVTWEGTETLMNGDVSDNYPKEPTSIKNNGEMIVQGSSVWVRRELDIPSDSGIVRDTVFLEVYRDGIGKFYLEHLKQGWVQASNPAMAHFVTKEILNSIRPDPVYSPENLSNQGVLPIAGTARRFDVMRRQDTSEGPMIVVGNTNYKKMGISERYLDESRDYVLTRMLNKTPDGRITRDIIIRYAENPVLGYVPREIEYFKAGIVLLDDFTSDMKYVTKRTKKLTVTSVRVNEPIDDTIFELEFPPGTRVHDMISDTHYTAGEPGTDPDPSD